MYIYDYGIDWLSEFGWQILFFFFFVDKNVCFDLDNGYIYIRIFILRYVRILCIWIWFFKIKFKILDFKFYNLDSKNGIIYFKKIKKILNWAFKSVHNGCGNQTSGYGELFLSLHHCNFLSLLFTQKVNQVVPVWLFIFLFGFF